MKNIKPRHLLEPIRIKIAVEFIQHEFRKIFPNIKEKQIWDKLDRDIKNLPKNKSFAPVRDFWNFFDSICFGLRLKNLTTILTSQNIKWTKEKVLVDDLYMGSKRDFKYLEKLNNEFPNGREIKDFLFRERNRNILKLIKKDSSLNSRSTFYRDNYLIIVKYQNNRLVITDGNRRFIKNILEGKEKVYAHVGREVKFPPYYNYWVPTSRIYNLVGHARLLLGLGDTKSFKYFCQTLGTMIKYSEFGKYEFYNRVIGYNTKYSKEDKFILKEVEKILKGP